MPCPIPLAPDNVVCGHGGICLPENASCACADGWSGRGDFVFGEPSCNIYLPAIKYLWVPVFVVHLSVLPFSVRYLTKIVSKASSGTFETARTSFIFGLCMVFANTFMAATAILKYLNPDQTLGTDGAVTTTFFIGSSTFYAGATMAVWLFLQINMKNAKIREGEFRQKFSKIFRDFQRYNPITLFSAILWMSMPMYMLASSSSEAFFGLALVHYVGAAITMISVSFSF